MRMSCSWPRSSIWSASSSPPPTLPARISSTGSMTWSTTPRAPSWGWWRALTRPAKTSRKLPYTSGGRPLVYDTALYVSSILFFGLFRVTSRFIKFTIFKFSSLVLLLSVLLSPSCLFASVMFFLTFGVHSLPSSLFSLLHLPLCFSPYVLAILLATVNPSK